MYKIFSRWYKGGDGAGRLRKAREVMPARWEEPLAACLSLFEHTWTRKHLYYRAGKTWQDTLATECRPTTEASNLAAGPVDPYRGRDNLLPLLMLVLRISNPIAPFLATVLVP
jgi:hypothetical protein